MVQRFLCWPLVLATALNYYAYGAERRASQALPTETSDEQANTMKISLKVKDKVMSATLIDSETTRDFISLLPLTLTMNDLFRREKFAHLPRAISTKGKRTHTYEVGQLIYWSPGPDLAIYYRHDGQEIPDPGIIVIGKIDSGVEALDLPGSVKVTIELIK
jgi:hypothetical protein